MNERIERIIKSIKAFTSSDRAIRMKKKEGQRIERVVTLYLKIIGKQKDVKVHVTSIICDVGEFPVIEIHCEDFCAELNYGSQYMLSNIETGCSKDRNVIDMLYSIGENVLFNKTQPSVLSKKSSLNFSNFAQGTSSGFPNSWVIINEYK